MKLEDVRSAYYSNSGKASDILRYLGLVGIGIVWFFRLQTGNKFTLPKDLLFPTYLLIAGLGFDLLQYLAGTVVWGYYNRHLEKKGTKKSEEFEAPRKINWPGNLFFWAKAISIGWAYYLLLSFLKNQFA